MQKVDDRDRWKAKIAVWFMLVALGSLATGFAALAVHMVAVAIRSVQGLAW